MELKVELTDSTRELGLFCCGVKAMDDFIHGKLESCVKNSFCKLYVVKGENEEVVALFALSFDSLRLDNDDKDDLLKEFAGTTTPHLTKEYDEMFWTKAHYPALEIAYLAVDKKFQKRHIGRDIIETIVDKAQNQTFAGCQFLTVDAYCTKEYNAVPFYQKCGFANIDIVPIFDTVRMYRNLLD